MADKEIAAAQHRLLGHIRADQAEIRRLQLQQREHVLSARNVGVKWAAIAEAVGLESKQAAYKRFGLPVKAQQRASAEEVSVMDNQALFD